MSVLFVHDHIFFKYKDQYYSRGGLPGEVLKRYINVFGSMTIVARCEDIKEMDENLTLSSIEGTKFVPVPNHKSIKSYYKISDVKNIIKNEVMNADHIISRVSTLGYIAAKYAKKYNKPYLVEVVGCTWDSMWNYSFKGKILAPFSYYNQKRIVKDAPYVVYVTKNFLQKRYPNFRKNINASNVSLINFDDNVIKNRLDKIRKSDLSKKTIIGTIGAIDVKYKGQETIIKTLGLLKKQGLNNFEYQIVGGGNQKYLKKIADKYKVNDQVKFLGTMPHNLVFSWLDKIDLYVQPSKTEGLPRALIEAMSRGLPAIGTDVGGIPELLEKKYTFSKYRKSEKELENILKTINIEDFLEQALRNYNVSKEYDKNLIEARRKSFFENFYNQD